MTDREREAGIDSGHGFHVNEHDQSRCPARNLVSPFGAEPRNRGTRGCGRQFGSIFGRAIICAGE